jgi:long-chain acyl-CoA synthetase
VPDPEYGEGLAAAIQPRPGSAPDPDALRTWMRERLAGYKVPRRLEFLPELPRDSMGKVFKRRLREQFLAAPA